MMPSRTELTAGKNTSHDVFSANFRVNYRQLTAMVLSNSIAMTFTPKMSLLTSQGWLSLE